MPRIAVNRNTESHFLRENSDCLYEQDGDKIWSLRHYKTIKERAVLVSSQKCERMNDSQQTDTPKVRSIAADLRRIEVQELE